MNLRRPILIALFEAVCLLAAVYFEPTHCVRGRLWGEAFFDGRPTSYWRHELTQWKVRKQPQFNWLGIMYTYERRPTLMDSVTKRWLNRPPRELPDAPRLLQGDPAALAVLFELLDDPSPRVRRFAQIGLGNYPDIPDDLE